MRSFPKKMSNLTILKEHHKVYRQIQHSGKDADVVEIQFQEILG